APVSSVITSGQAYTSGGLGGILSGQLDLASSDRYVVAPRDRTHDFKVFNQAGSPQSAEGWKSPGTANVRVLARQTNSSWGFAGIRAILNDGTIWQYPVQSTTGAYDPGAVTKKLWVAYTWENAEGAHTTLGPKTDFDYWR